MLPVLQMETLSDVPNAGVHAGGVTGAGQGAHKHSARLPRPNNPHGTHYNLARQQQRVSAAGQRGPPPPKAQSCPS